MVETLRMQARHEAGADMAALIDASDGMVWLNEERSALQGYDCKGSVGLHIPIRAAFSGELAASLEALRSARVGVVLRH
jgi:hypothetical protein